MMKKKVVMFSILAMTLWSCGENTGEQKTSSGLENKHFQSRVKNKETALFTLKNKAGAEVCITNYGGRIVSLMMPDRDSVLQDVVLGFDHIQDYVEKPSSFGATVGRFANRIAYGKFPLEGDTISLDVNSGEHTIHGGVEGWQNQVFDVAHVSDNVLTLQYISKDGEGGFPGEMHVKVTFSLSDDNALRIDYWAETDQKTVVNMTNHSFFNLSGDPATSILDHVLRVQAHQYTPLDEGLITTGELEPVATTVFDFTEPISIHAALQRDSLHPQVQLVQGFDHNYVLDNDGRLDLPVATVYAPKTGIAMEVYTTEPGLQVYTGNMLDGSRKGKNKIVYQPRAGLCLEPQHYPDSPNKTEWPSTVLEPGAEYASTTIYKFGIKE